MADVIARRLGVTPTRRPKRPWWHRVFHLLRWKLAIAVELVVLVALWELLQGVLEVWDPKFLPPPSDVAGALVELGEAGVLGSHFQYSATNAGLGFLLAGVAGIGLGLAMGSSRLFYDLVGGPFWALYATPRIAFQPLLVLWLGFGSAPKILIVFLMAVFPIAISTMEGVRGVDASLVKAARVYGASRAEVFFKVQLWAALPLILTGLRMGVARSMIGVVIGEFIGGSQGLGFLIFRKAGEVQLDAAIGVTILLVVLALAGMALVNGVRRIIAPWYVEEVVRS